MENDINYIKYDNDIEINLSIHYASYLINDDGSNLESSEIEKLQDLQKEIGYCVNCEIDNTFFGIDKLTSLHGDVCKYTFRKY
jgi:hypothetical protein